VGRIVAIGGGDLSTTAELNSYMITLSGKEDWHWKMKLHLWNKTARFSISGAARMQKRIRSAMRTVF
jgi:hypothetical protein